MQLHQAGALRCLQHLSASGRLCEHHDGGCLRSAHRGVRQCTGPAYVDRASHVGVLAGSCATAHVRRGAMCHLGGMHGNVFDRAEAAEQLLQDLPQVLVRVGQARHEEAAALLYGGSAVAPRTVVGFNEKVVPVSQPLKPQRTTSVIDAESDT